MQHDPFQIPRPVLTGASGFVGTALAARLGSFGRIAMAGGDWRSRVASCDLRGATVIHLAARVHDPKAAEADFESDNVEKTRVLAEAAAAGGAARFVFASTVKVFGEESGERPFRETDEPNPPDAYARSKWLAEEALREVAARTGLAIVIVRIPLTFGPAAGGNFRALLRMADSSAWLPFGAIANRRSLIHVDDLAGALVLAASHPAATGRTLVAAHPEPVSTTRLVESIRRALGRPRRLVAVRPAFLEAAAGMIGQGARMRRLTRSLEADSSALVRALGWVPRVSLDEAIAASVSGVRSREVR